LNIDTAPTAATNAGPAEEPIILPYCGIVGQYMLRRALEIAFVAPSVGGVLATGQRGTAKSTTVRAFARMAYGKLPVTLPIGATDDRILGGWQVEDLMASRAEWREGLIWEAGGGPEPGMLYIDEVNLLDDHLANIVLDAASTGILIVQRESAAKDPRKVRFSLVGTMNPDEGSLRPQLLDRFGLVVLVESARSPDERGQILRSVLRFEEEAQNSTESEYLEDGYQRDSARRVELCAAQKRLSNVEIPNRVIDIAANIAANLQVEGHRGELAMLRAARAVAAIEGEMTVSLAHVIQVAPLALVHRRGASDSGTVLQWSDEDEQNLQTLTGVEPT
jgi:magnesium chelatase subunit I